jgi:hypothetical protein
MGGGFGGRRPLGKPRYRWKDALLGYAVDILQVRNWKAARNGECWKKTIGKTVIRKSGEALKKRKKTK